MVLNKISRYNDIVLTDLSTSFVVENSLPGKGGGGDALASNSWRSEGTNLDGAVGAKRDERSGRGVQP